MCSCNTNWNLPQLFYICTLICEVLFQGKKYWILFKFELAKTATFYILSHTLKYILFFQPNISFCKINSLASNQLIVCESQIYVSWPCQEQKWASYCSQASWLLLRMSVEDSKRIGRRKSVSSRCELLLLAGFCTWALSRLQSAMQMTSFVPIVQNPLNM